MKKIFVINGSANSAKDTFVETIQDHLTTGIFQIHNISTVDWLRDFAHKIGGKEKTNEVRNFMKDIKESGDNNFDYSFKYVKEKIDEGSVLDIYFIHCREPEKIDRFKKELKAKTILVRREGIDIPTNSSDQNVENYEYDYIIENNGTLEEFKLKAEEFFVNKIEGKVN